MSLRFLILNTDYPEFLDWFYAIQPSLKYQPYEAQLRARYKSLFGVADFYSSSLRRLGHEAWDVYANNEHMQSAWALEHGLKIDRPGADNTRLRDALQLARRAAARTPVRRLKNLFLPVLRSLDKERTCIHGILAAQIKHYQPDILLNQDMHVIGAGFLGEMRPHYGLLVGQIASPLPQGEDFTEYDLMISSLPNFVAHFRSIGVNSEQNGLGFDPSILDRLGHPDRDISISFVGSLSMAHETRIKLLEYLCLHLPMKIWGAGAHRLPPSSPIRKCYKGNAWGIEMYEILRRSKLTLNSHIGVAESYANNLRLYEATGAGACLVTDEKDNLSELFEPGKEVVTYRSPEDCAEAISYYLAHDEERETIARAGRDRTLRDHTYYHRMREFISLIEAHQPPQARRAVS